eukprot:5333137-Ditylum_brightwellii.AAC.1
MCNNGTETQQSAGIGNETKVPSSTCSLHTKQIAPNLMCNDGTKPNNQQGSNREGTMKTQQLAMIGKQMNDEDSTISRDWKWGKRTKLYTFSSHRANCAELDVQQWHKTQQSAGI